MAAPVEFKFKLGAYAPATIPMDRLAAYLLELAIVLGERQSVHFDRLEEGSTVPVVRVDWEAVPKVRKRAIDVRNNEGPDEALRAKASIEKMLTEDNASAELVESSGARVLYFPGRERPVENEYGPFNQPGTLDGVPIVIGGERDLVPVHLQDGDRIHLCKASRTIAKQLAPFLFSGHVRASGIGRWFRDADGGWEMRSFQIHGFTELRSESVAQAAERLHAVRAGWKNPVADLMALRGEPED